MENLSLDAQLFVKTFIQTKRIREVVNEIALISHIKEYGCERFYIIPFRKKWGKTILSLSCRSVSDEIWELAKVVDGKVETETIRRDLLKEQAINGVWKFLETGEWEEL